MTATVIVNGQNATIKFEYTSTLAKIQAVALAAAHHLWIVGYGDHGTPETPRTFDDLTNAERLDILDTYVKRVLQDAARTYSVNDAIETARRDAENDADGNLILAAKTQL